MTAKDRTKENALHLYEVILLQFGLDAQEFTATREHMGLLIDSSIRSIVRYIDVLTEMNLIQRVEGRKSTYRILMNLEENSRSEAT